MEKLDLDFSALLVGLSLLTGMIWLVDHLLFAANRKKKGIRKEPIVVEYARSFFPVIFLVFLIRSFLAEPFRIPSDSMMPTLLDGDFILVNKFAYGIRIPVINKKLIDLGTPKRGDVAVFRYPGQSPDDPDKGNDFIKRVIGIPGDEVTYKDRRLYVNGQPVATDGLKAYQGKSRTRDYANYADLSEKMADVEHHILLAPPPQFYAGPEGTWRVGPNEYLVLGDNRSNSKDGRFWGMVPDENLIGKAFLIWMNWDGVNGGVQFGRIGTVIE